ncbi:hypothetical protein AVEN_221004-1 [Araneus ventricosus]|uniref:Uncharacterized protein n=1 Tax=Araneus ventricosus TaxID=182803 RepID=A0A4Y2EMA5_ARAVE|nr:hypothetical protein AVEN_221004-1 [Araneus ventricosus]
MFGSQNSFKVLERMIVAGSKIGTIGGMVIPLPVGPLQQFLCAQQRVRARVAPHLFQHLKRVMVKQNFPVTSRQMAVKYSNRRESLRHVCPKLVSWYFTYFISRRYVER